MTLTIEIQITCFEEMHMPGTLLANVLNKDVALSVMTEFTSKSMQHFKQILSVVNRSALKRKKKESHVPVAVNASNNGCFFTHHMVQVFMVIS